MITKTHLLAAAAAGLLICVSAPASAAKNVCQHGCQSSFTDALVHAGRHSIAVHGSIVGALVDGTHGGALEVSHDPPAVPEPTTWAATLLGFGILGFSMRRRRRKSASLTQCA